MFWFQKLTIKNKYYDHLFLKKKVKHHYYKKDKLQILSKTEKFSSSWSAGGTVTLEKGAFLKMLNSEWSHEPGTLLLH